MTRSSGLDGDIQRLELEHITNRPSVADCWIGPRVHPGLLGPITPLLAESSLQQDDSTRVSEYKHESSSLVKRLHPVGCCESGIRSGTRHALEVIGLDWLRRLPRIGRHRPKADDLTRGPRRASIEHVRVNPRGNSQASQKKKPPDQSPAAEALNGARLVAHCP